MKIRKLKIGDFLRSNYILLGILILGLFLRIYKPGQLFLYGHDNDLAGWIVKDVVANKHLRLIGQETSTIGIYIGPLYYYALIPFYLLFGMDPIGGVALVAVLGLFSIWSFYYVFSKIFGLKAGLVASFLYAVSFYTVFNDREVVPTMPVLAWSVWYFYAINLLLKGKQSLAYPILGLLIGLIWNLNVALILLTPLILVAQWLSKKKLKLRPIATGAIALFITSLPLIAFELRHGFSQARALHVALTTESRAIIYGLEKLRRVVLLSSKNVSGFIWGDLTGISYGNVSLVLLLILAFLLFRKFLSRNQGIIMFLWLFIYVVFFSSYGIILSEYYLNGMMVIWIAIVGLGILYLLTKSNLKKWGIFALVIFAVINLFRFFSLNINKSGYLERKAIVADIKRDATERNFPCIAISYITNPGYDLGYRYLFYLEDMHVNRPDSGSPVYTIVFPLKPIFEVDKTFGALGIIYPDYEIYSPQEVKDSCAGENSNLTDSMFGYSD
ncbi:glycosyltransferase family 39 protein [Patescibacteria group bacterium]|nr:glycosyltransferase family 39 protein [Patescibacteria group bacterium]